MTKLATERVATSLLVEENQLKGSVSQESPLKKSYLQERSDAPRAELDCPVSMPNAGAFLWNKQMFIQMNCRGYAVAKFMQPEPSQYSYGPNIEATTFIQPEHPYYAHHPGRFFYVKDENTKEIYSLPYEPCRKEATSYLFSAGLSDITWRIECKGVQFDIKLTLSADDVAELWSFTAINLTDEEKTLSIFPYFSIGYQSWMNQSCFYDKENHAIVAKSITPYQKIEQYHKHQHFKETTFFIADKEPDSFCCNQKRFEGEGGLHSPCKVNDDNLGNIEANHETACAVMQFTYRLQPNESVQQQFVFGACQHETDISSLKEKYFSRPNAFTLQEEKYASYQQQITAPINIECDDSEFCQFVNYWLPRQVFYHGDVNRLTTDPQTRNYLQDNMAMSYIAPNTAKQAFLTALSQQDENGAMPDGILLHHLAELKYINQVPHADHNVWLAICIKAYLDETNDKAFLLQDVDFSQGKQSKPVYQHIEMALDYLLSKRDYRGLSLIEQGDWCDPMNMVGHLGKGVSSWLSLALSYALDCWCYIAESYLDNYSQEKLSHYQTMQKSINEAVNDYCWDGQWYARGRTDEDKPFGISEDNEGKIFLNPQSWALLSKAAGTAKQFSLLNEVDKQLSTPYGVMMLAPAYTKMREDIGRITQKFPGTAENGSIYNHASIFYAYSLFQVGEHNKAFQVLKKMVVSSEDMLVKGQLPIFIPNYYRGAYYQYPNEAGRSSHLFNTGTVAWFYRCIIEEFAGLKGKQGALVIQPKLPDSLSKLTGVRQFMGATFHFVIERKNTANIEVFVDGTKLPSNQITDIVAYKEYHLTVNLPK